MTQRQASLFPVADDTSLPMRPYQQEAFDRVVQAHHSGKDGGLVVIPTGGGKTVVAVKVQRALDMRCVFLVHRDELADQTIEKFLMADPNVDIGLVKAESDDLTARVVVASVQTLANEKRLDRLVRATAGHPLLVVSDEAHHDPSVTRRVALQRLGTPGSFRMGMTATPMRHGRKGDENASLRTLYPDGILYQVSMVELMASGYLAWLKAKIIETDTDLSAVRTRGGDLMPTETAETVNNAARNALVVDAWRQHAQDRTRTIVFCADRKHAYDERDAFKAIGVNPGLILGTTPKAERKEIYRLLRAGEVPVLIGVDVFTEGWDEPSVDCGIFARPTESLVLYTQMVGRLLRPSRATGKTDALALDVADNAGSHRLMNFWTLAEAEGLLPAPSSGSGPAEKKERPASMEELFDTILEHRKRTSRDAQVFGRSEYTWLPVDVGGNKVVYMAPIANDTWLYLDHDGGEAYRPRLLEGGVLKSSTYDGSKYKTPPKTTDLFQRGLELETAMSVAESRGALYMGDNPHLRRTATWRRSRVAPTPQQAAFAKRLGIAVGAGDTKGSLSERIEAVLFTREHRRLAR